jgi:hypothetical protein
MPGKKQRAEDNRQKKGALSPPYIFTFKINLEQYVPIVVSFGC